MARGAVFPAHPPDSDDLDVVRRAASSCTACDLAGRATQTVSGEGRAVDDLRVAATAL